MKVRQCMFCGKLPGKKKWEQSTEECKICKVDLIFCKKCYKKDYDE